MLVLIQKGQTNLNRFKISRECRITGSQNLFFLRERETSEGSESTRNQFSIISSEEFLFPRHWHKFLSVQSQSLLSKSIYKQVPRATKYTENGQQENITGGSQRDRKSHLSNKMGHLETTVLYHNSLLPELSPEQCEPTFQVYCGSQSNVVLSMISTINGDHSSMRQGDFYEM